MFTYLCDICKDNQSTFNLKIKCKDNHLNLSNDYLDIKLCDRCYKNLIGLIKKYNSEICKCYFVYQSTDNMSSKSVCYGTREAEECYCNGDIKCCTHYPERRNK